MNTAPAHAKGFLIRLAAEGVAPLVGGCAGVLLAGPVGGVAGGVVGKVCEEAVRYFGPAIVESWLGWFRRQPPALQAAAVEAAAGLSPEDARLAAEQALAEAAPGVGGKDREIVLEYLTGIPAAMRRSLPPDPSRGGLSVPPTMALNDPRQLLGLLPRGLPPYPAGSELPSTPYRLGEMLGAGGFGAVYRATTPTLQHLTFAIKFCLDASLLDGLERERANLDRLQSAGETRAAGADRIVRLYGYDFDHPTPYLVYEYVPGRDLAAHLTARRSAEGKGMPADEALAVVRQVAEALAFAHGRGLVHRDLKPANVLLSPLPVTPGRGAGGEGAFHSIKLTDFGIGGVTAAASSRGRIGSTTLGQLDAAEQATLFRGAGTPLYSSPEQRRGEPPDPRHDLFSLGVLWYQLLTGDVTRELHPGWADELLDDHDVPPAHVDALRACVGVMKKRPENGGRLLELLARPTPPAPAPARPVLDARPVERPTAHAEREDVARAVVALQVARNRDWRWGLMLAGIITGGIAAVPFLVFVVLSIALPSTPANHGAHVTFNALSSLLGAVAIGFGLTAVTMGRSRSRRKRKASEALAEAIATAQRKQGVPAVVPEGGDADALCQAGWDLVREIEERHLTRGVEARVRLLGSWFFDYSIKVYVDGHLVGEGGTRRGVDLPARLCRGTHLIDMRTSWQNLVWRRPFVVARDGRFGVEIGPLVGNSDWWKLEVVAAH